MKKQLHKVAITGASSGIGAALARELAIKGADVALIARREDRLHALADELTAAYPSQSFPIHALDVAQTDAILPALEAVKHQLGGLDCVIANAGITNVNATGKGDFSADIHLFQVNLIGAAATCEAAARLFRQQGSGHIVGMASIAAFCGIPGSAAYSASKAGFGHYLVTLGMELRRQHIDVTAIYPGFIDTELAPHMDKMPFVIGAEKAAATMVKAIAAGKRRVIVPGWPWRLVLPALRWTPEALLLKMFS